MPEKTSTITQQLMEQQEVQRKSPAIIRAKVEAFIRQVRQEQECREADRRERHQQGRTRSSGDRKDANKLRVWIQSSDSDTLSSPLG